MGELWGDVAVPPPLQIGHWHKIEQVKMLFVAEWHHNNGVVVYIIVIFITLQQWKNVNGTIADRN